MPAEYPNVYPSQEAHEPEVDNRAALRSRPCRQPNFEAEDRALAVLATELALNPRNMLQKLVETALVLCQADTAGISLLEQHDGTDVFRWEALAGVFGSMRNSTMPRHASPCGVCIDQDATQLMYLADREFPALRNDPRFVEALLIPFHFRGQPIGTVWVVTHGFDRKFDREDERVIRALAAFASAGWQLWKATEAKDEFVALLGHELRNPLAAIQSAISVVQHRNTDAGSREHALSIVADQVRDLTRIVEGVLDVSRLDYGRLQLVAESLDLRAVVKHTVDAILPQIEGRGHHLVISQPDSPLEIIGDSVRLSQLLTNLLDNAKKYTPDGGQIWLDLSADREHVQISVRDTGVGISADELGRIFKPFQQIGGCGDRANRGLGLGLTLVERLAHLHGGTVTATSGGRGQGCKFTVRLPRHKVVPAAGATRREDRSLDLTVARRILLIEDNPILSYAFGLELRMEGHEVRVAANGQAGLDAAPEFRPEVVLLDLGLPDIDGYTVARRLRDSNIPGQPEPLIIALTGHVQEQYRLASKDAGCDCHIVKPVDPDVLRTILRAPSAYRLACIAGPDGRAVS